MQLKRKVLMAFIFSKNNLVSRPTLSQRSHDLPYESLKTCLQTVAMSPGAYDLGYFSDATNFGSYRL